MGGLQFGLQCVFVVHRFSFRTQTHTPLRPALCLFYCEFGSCPTWASCHCFEYSMYSESCASFFCFVFFQCVWCFCFVHHCLTVVILVVVRTPSNPRKLVVTLPCKRRRVVVVVGGSVTAFFFLLILYFSWPFTSHAMAVLRQKRQVWISC